MVDVILRNPSTIPPLSFFGTVGTVLYSRKMVLLLLVFALGLQTGGHAFVLRRFGGIA